MASFPFFSLPYNNYYNHYSRYNNYLKNNKKIKETENVKMHETSMVNEDMQVLENNTQSSTVNQKNPKYENRSSKYSYSGPIHFNFNSLSDSEKPIIEIMGIELYLDDLIIIGLLFFLYQEGVKDEMLFIILMLLLLT